MAWAENGDIVADHCRMTQDRGRNVVSFRPLARCVKGKKQRSPLKPQPLSTEAHRDPEYRDHWERRF